MERRHPDKLNYVHQKEESLKMAAVPITAPRKLMERFLKLAMDTALLDRITNTIERFSTRVLETERKLREEMEIKFLAEIERKERNMQEAYKQERDHYERELQDLRVGLLID